VRPHGTRKNACVWCTHDVSAHAADPEGRKGKFGPCHYGEGIGTTIAVCECQGSRPPATSDAFPIDAWIFFAGGLAKLASGLHAALVASKETRAAPPEDKPVDVPFPPLVPTKAVRVAGADVSSYRVSIVDASPAAAERVAAKTSASGERKMLTALAQHPGGLTSEELAVMTGYASTRRGEFLVRLRDDGRVVRAGVHYRITAAGRTWLGPFEELPKGDALRAHWLEKLRERESTVLAAIAAVWPEGLSSAEVRERTSYGTTSVGEALVELVGRKLVVKASRLYTASPTLFDESAR
jgi:hypothetical protein